MSRPSLMIVYVSLMIVAGTGGIAGSTKQYKDVFWKWTSTIKESFHSSYPPPHLQYHTRTTERKDRLTVEAGTRSLSVENGGQGGSKVTSSRDTSVPVKSISRGEQVTSGSSVDLSRTNLSSFTLSSLDEQGSFMQSAEWIHSGLGGSSPQTKKSMNKTDVFDLRVKVSVSETDGSHPPVPGMVSVNDTASSNLPTELSVTEIESSNPNVKIPVNATVSSSPVTKTPFSETNSSSPPTGFSVSRSDDDYDYYYGYDYYYDYEGMLKSDMSNLSLTPEDTARCLSWLSDKFVRGVRGIISVQYKPSAGLRRKLTRGRICTLVITALRPHYINIKIQTARSQGGLSLSFEEFLNPSAYTYKRAIFTDLENPGRVILMRSSVKVHMELLDPAKPAELLMMYDFMPEDDYTLWDMYSSSTPGYFYVEPPYYDGGTDLLSDTDMSWEVEIGCNERVLVTFRHFSIGLSNSLTVCTNCSSGRGLKEMFRGRNAPPSSLYSCVTLKVTYSSHAIKQNLVVPEVNPGFQILYSYHNDSELLQRMPDGTWNCSTPHWPQYRLHFTCNVLTECWRGEDEAQCPYSPPSEEANPCGEVGWLPLSDGCVRFMASHDAPELSWAQASKTCRLVRARLVSLNTPAKWREMVYLMSYRTWDNLYVGLRSRQNKLSVMYNQAYQWNDLSIAYNLNIQIKKEMPSCAIFDSPRGRMDVLKMDSCLTKHKAQFLCERKTPSDIPVNISRKDIDVNGTSLVKCPSGHVVRNFLSCDSQSACWTDADRACRSVTTPSPPSYACAQGNERVPYTLVCDGRHDCSDRSDENFCVFPACNDSACENPEAEKNNGEMLTNSTHKEFTELGEISDVILRSAPPPGIVNLDGRGGFTIQPHPKASNSAHWCPATHFHCHYDRFYCLPVYTRCNNVFDCPGHEDEEGCQVYTCSGFYRCRKSSVCLHELHLCDRTAQCPQQEDEVLCDVQCPPQCFCQGLSFFCTQPFIADHYPALRFLDASGSGMKSDAVAGLSMLVFLGLARCGLQVLQVLNTPNLRFLDLSENYLTKLNESHLTHLNNLKSLRLSANRLTILFNTDFDSQRLFPALTHLDLSHVKVDTFNSEMFTVFPNLTHMNVSGSGVKSVIGKGFSHLTHLRLLDLRGCPVIYFDSDIFEGLTSLKVIYAENYKLCCPLTLPVGFNVLNCHAPSSEISSCDSLLQSDMFRILLAMFATLTILGNLGSLVYRVFMDKASSKLGFSVFVIHLCVADFLMGVYLSILGVADHMYRDSFLWKDIHWRQSATCWTAGFLSLLSSEMSAFIICTITLDRFLVIRFPFSRLRFSPTAAHVSCWAIWCVCVMIAALPLLPVTSHWNFYGQSGLCIPLPITTNNFAGYTYSFSIIIALNFVLVLLIAAGQLFIYWSIRANSMTATDSTSKSKDLTIARRLITIALSDFLCWFPIGILGLLARAGVPVGKTVNVAIAILVLPLNSAVNPFLYTLNMVQERRRRARETRLQKLLYSQRSQSLITTALTMREEGEEAGNILRQLVHEGGLLDEDVKAYVAAKTKTSR